MTTPSLVPDRCDVCSVTDTAPKHTTAYGPTPEGWVPVTRHISCCAQQGCPGGSCPMILELSGGLAAQELADWITGGGLAEAMAA